MNTDSWEQRFGTPKQSHETVREYLTRIAADQLPDDTLNSLINDIEAAMYSPSRSVDDVLEEYDEAHQTIRHAASNRDEHYADDQTSSDDSSTELETSSTVDKVSDASTLTGETPPSTTTEQSPSSEQPRPSTTRPRAVDRVDRQFARLQRIWRFAAHPAVAIGISALILTVPGVLYMFAAEQWPNAGDNINIVARSVELTQGTPFWAWPDPPLRYPPIAILIKAFGMIGVGPTAVTSAYSAILEFVVITTLIYYLTWYWFNRDAAAIATYLTAALTYHIYPYSSPYFTGPFWHYIYPIPAFLLTIRFASTAGENRRHLIYAGLALAIVGNLQLFFAVVATITISAYYVVHQEWKELVGTGIISAVTASPLYLVAILSREENLTYWLSSGDDRLSDWSAYYVLADRPQLLLTILLIFAVVVGMYWARYYGEEKWQVDLFTMPVIAFSVTGVGFLIGVFPGSFWVKHYFGYASKWFLFIWLGWLGDMVAGILIPKIKHRQKLALLYD